MIAIAMPHHPISAPSDVAMIFNAPQPLRPSHPDSGNATDGRMIPTDETAKEVVSRLLKNRIFLSNQISRRALAPVFAVFGIFVNRG